MSKSASRTRATAHRRPAELTAASAGLTGLVVALAAGDTVTAAVALIGFIPAVVSFVVEHGGIRGLCAQLWGTTTPARTEPEVGPAD
jgi:hypothetical protein